MKLEKLLERMDYKVLAGSTDIEISTLVYDSRKVEKASVFVCISGAVSDAHDFIPDVVKKGAAAVVVEKDVTPIEGVTYIKVDDTRLALACMSAAYFDYPAEKIKTIGITGTKGKTTTTYMVKSILESAGIKTGLSWISGDCGIMPNCSCERMMASQSLFFIRWKISTRRSGREVLLAGIEDFGVRVGGGEGLCDLVDVRLQAGDKGLVRQSQTLHLVGGTAHDERLAATHLVIGDPPSVLLEHPDAVLLAGIQVGNAQPLEVKTGKALVRAVVLGTDEAVELAVVHVRHFSA